MTDCDQPAHMIEIGVDGWGYARLTFDEAQGLRKTIPRWAAADTAHHFFKHSDEQTILAVQALDNAIERHQLTTDFHDWAVISAPQFLGRLAGAATYHKFLKEGTHGVSLHTIPQHSLHSVAGAISVLLGCHGPNLGVGGGPRTISDAILTALTIFDQRQSSGVWLICTGWNFEPLPGRDGKCATQAVCYAFALALTPASTTARCGSLRMQWDGVGLHPLSTSTISVAQIVEQLVRLDSLQLPCDLLWPLEWGATALLRLVPLVQPPLHAVSAQEPSQ